MASENKTISENKQINPTAEKSMPDAFIILFFVVLLAAILTHFIPAGLYDVIKDPVTHKSVLVPGSFRFATDSIGVPIFAEGGHIGFFNFAFEGMVSGSKWGSAIGVMMFIILTGGAFGVMMKTEAINNGILALIERTKRFEMLFIPIIFLMFATGGAVIGMGEETIAFCIVLYPLMRALGYDGITTVLITYVASQMGFATSWMNPFSVAIAQGIAGLPIMSGMQFRIVMWMVFTSIGIIFTMRYAKKIKANPQSSPCYKIDSKLNELAAQEAKSHQFNWVDATLLLTFMCGIIWIIWGVMARGYYIPEISSQFFTIGCAIGTIAVLTKRLRVNEVAESFKSGAKDLLPAAMIVGMAKGIVLILGGDQANTPSVLNTVLHFAGHYLAMLPEAASAVCMFLFQSIFNFFIASGSGQAALTMPIMAPLSDLVGVSRQIAVLAFQLGDGLTNILIPTSAALIGCLGVVNVDWMVWAKFIGRYMLIIIPTAIIFILTAVAINFV